MQLAMRVRQIQSAEILSDEDTFLMSVVKAPIDEVKKETCSLL